MLTGISPSVRLKIVKEKFFEKRGAGHDRSRKPKSRRLGEYENWRKL